ncbi:MAG: mercuric reductase [Acidimicrobiia bacterium]|nr:mercuric reductase [Acidimicrobiia bacterium]
MGASGSGRLDRASADHEAEARLLSHVRPPDWVNPAPRDRYDLVVIGGGTAGLVSAMGAAGLGARVALVERHRLGGDCLNTGCVPSKALLRSARAVREARLAAGLGTAGSHVAADAREVLRQVRDLRAAIAPNDSAARLTAAGVDLFFGDACLTSPETAGVGASVLRFRRAIVATGTRPALPPIPGLADVPFLTTDSVFDLADLPRRLLVLGAGPVGCELAQALALLGSQVHLIDIAPRVLPNEDPDASALVARQLAADGVDLRLAARVERVGREGSGVRATGSGAAGPLDVDADAVLVAAGRTPNVESLGLAAAGVRTSAGGVVVDDRLRTSSRRIYAAGDVAIGWKFTHAADASARIAIQNALFYGRRRVSALVVPWCSYTHPEVAHVGLTAAEAARSGAGALTVPLGDVDRAVLDRDAEGFVRVHHRAGRILGCTAVGPRAGELIGYAAEAMRAGRSLGDFAGAVFPYPTHAETFRKLGDAWRRSRLTASVRAAFARYFAVARWLP